MASPRRRKLRESELFDAAEYSGLQLVSDHYIKNLTSGLQSPLIPVKFGIQQKEERSVVIVNFIDFLTGRPVVSCR